jgi:O-antigen/teichoic acid export membrane protein
MSIIKKLLSQTAIYGLSSIFGRFLNYLLVPLYTYYFTASEYGVVSEFYAYAGFFSVVLLCGLETGYFRFRQKDVIKDSSYSTALFCVILINCAFLLAISYSQQYLATLLHYEHHSDYILYFAAILSLDSVAAIPFARLRAENKAWRFASIKVIEILLTIALSLFFIVLCPRWAANNPPQWLSSIYQPTIGVGYIFIANLLASAAKFLLLSSQLAGLAWGFDKAVFKRLMRYSAPMVIIGFAGVINEMLDRALLKVLLPFDTQHNLELLGIYGACYKLSILMSLFIQAFRYAAEPFFFSYSKNADAKQVYATVLNFFVIFCVFIFLVVTLFLNVFQYFVGAAFRDGLAVVPILLWANLCLGVYVNLSIWYKLTDRTLLGAGVSVAGALLTVALNVLWIPKFGYIGSAWATLICYASMAIVSYLLGRIYYPVPYDIKRIIAYSSLGLMLYSIHAPLQALLNWHYSWVLSSLLLSVYLISAILGERKSKTNLL